MIGQGPGSIVRKIARKYSQPFFQGLLCSRGMDLLLLCVVNVCQQFFHFPLITCQIDIRKAKFIQKFIANDNSICRLFSKHAEINLKKLFRL